MANETTSKTPPTSARRQRARQAITLEPAHALTPTGGKADSMSTTFGHESVDHASIRENVEEHLVRLAMSCGTT
jgi:hypothetical protein